MQAQGGADDDGDGEDAGDAENKYKPLHLQDMSHSKEYIDVCAADGDETSAYKAVRLQHLALSKTAQDPRAAIAQDVHRYEATQDASSTVDARAAIAEEVSRYEAVRLEDALPGDARAAIAEEVDRYDAVHSEDGELERQAESCAEMTEAAVVHHEEICDDSLANVTTNEVSERGICFDAYYSVPARLGKGQGAKEIGHSLARERPNFGHNLVRER